jgi:hypothetical protein
MLFERIHYRIDNILQKRYQDTSRKTNAHLLDNKNKLHYGEIISEIRRGYFQGLSPCKNYSGGGSGSASNDAPSSSPKNKKYSPSKVMKHFAVIIFNYLTINIGKR